MLGRLLKESGVTTMSAFRTIGRNKPFSSKKSDFSSHCWSTSSTDNVSSITEISTTPTSSDASSETGEEALVTAKPVQSQNLFQLKKMKQIICKCNVCGSKIIKTFTEHSYRKGIVIIRCDSCQSLHLIADNMGWFSHFDGKNIEDYLKQKGEEVKKVEII